MGTNNPSQQQGGHNPDDKTQRTPHPHQQDQRNDENRVDRQKDQSGGTKTNHDEDEQRGRQEKR